MTDRYKAIVLLDGQGAIVDTRGLFSPYTSEGKVVLVGASHAVGNFARMLNIVDATEGNAAWAAFNSSLEQGGETPDSPSAPASTSPEATPAVPDTASTLAGPFQGEQA